MRDARIGAAIESVLYDMRHAARGLRRNPGFAAAAILTLALGIGSTVAGFTQIGVTLVGGDHPEPLVAGTVSTDFFRILGVTAALGRTFDVGRENQCVAVLTHALWQRRFGGDPSIVYIEGRPDPAPGEDNRAGFQPTLPGYFATLGLPWSRAGIWRRPTALRLPGWRR